MHTKIFIFIFAFLFLFVAGSVYAQTIEEVDPSVFGAPFTDEGRSSDDGVTQKGVNKDADGEDMHIFEVEDGSSMMLDTDRAGSMENETEDSYIFQNNESDFDFIKKGGSSVSAKAVEVRGWDPEKKEEFLGTVKTHAELQSGQDLENFAKGILVEDENMEDVAIGEEGVQITYRIPAKLFGIFEKNIKADISVGNAGARDPEGRVKIKFPWYSFFYRIPDAVSGSVLTTDIDSGLSSLEGERFQHAVQAQARLFQTISNVLKTKHDVAMNAIRNLK
ncbi:MAG: hypothetical protein Q8O83_04695 [bacterium]|nr:hypothetical protein [bacterium]